MLLVLDTMVLLQGLQNEEGPAGEVLSLVARGKLKIVLSPSIIEEYEDVLNRPVFGIPRGVVSGLVQSLKKRAKKVKDSLPTAKAQLGLPDRNDWRFVAAADAGQADAIVTRNFQHFPQEHIRATVMSPPQVLDVARGLKRNPREARSRR